MVSTTQQASIGKVAQHIVSSYQAQEANEKQREANEKPCRQFSRALLIEGHKVGRYGSKRAQGGVKVGSKQSQGGVKGGSRRCTDPG